METNRLGIFPKIYLTWASVVILIVFLKGGWSNDNITHVLILVFLVLSLFAFKLFNPKNPKFFFIFSGVVLAAFGEGAYMISKPVLDSLLISRDVTFGQFMYNFLIDLGLTMPVYIVIFYVIWWLINKFNFSRWEYVFFFALGQALGDGSSFFFLNPFLVLFIPFIMLNYHAMNVAPFLTVENHLVSKSRSDSKWKYFIAVGLIWLTYFLGGTYIKIIANIFGLE